MQSNECEAKKLTQVQVAQSISVDVANVSRWERGGMISPKNLDALCKLYGVSVDSILTG